MRTTAGLITVCAAYAVGVYAGDDRPASAFPAIVSIVLGALSAAAAYPCRAPRVAFALLVAAAFAFGTSRLPRVAWPDDHSFDAECSGRVASPIEGSHGRSVFTVDDVDCFHGRDPTPVAGKMRVIVASAEAGVQTGDRIRVFGKRIRPPPALNDGEVDRARSLAREGVRYVFRVRTPDSMEVVGAADSWPLSLPRFAESQRLRLSAALRAQPERESAALVAAILLGDRRLLPRPLVESFVATGTLHIVAVSGLHLVFVTWAFVVVARWVGQRFERILLCLGVRRFAWMGALPVAFFYLHLAGAPPSAVRAFVMLGITTLALVWNRPCSSLRAIFLTVLLVSVIDPATLFDISFLLSVSAVVAIVVLGPSLWQVRRAPPGMRPAPLWLRFRALISAGVRTSMAATLGTAPVTAYFFQTVAFAGLAANLILIPIGSALLAASIAWGFLHALLPDIATTFLAVPLFLAHVFNTAVATLARPSEPLLVTFAPTIIQLFLLSVAILLFAFRAERRGLLTASLALVVVALGLEIHARATRAPKDSVRVTFLAVGQGDSALVEFPNGRTMMIDAGGSLAGDDTVGARTVVPFLRWHRIPRIDWFVLSHPHVDHGGGLGAIVRAVDVGEVWASGQPWDGPALSPLRAALTERNIPVRSPPPIPVCASSDEWLCLVHPVTKPGAPGYFEDLSVNSNSLVVRLTVGGIRILFTGDIESEVESDLADAPKLIQADILKVPHHGSRTSSTDGFVSAVGPVVAIASLGRANPFRFPHPAVVSRYRAQAVRLFRTDVDGQITLTISASYALLASFVAKSSVRITQQTRK